MNNLRVGTFNLFQFVAPPYSWYEKNSTFSKKQWDQKISWIKQQITKMNCDIIGFQEVFSTDELKALTKELGFNYFVTVDSPKVDNNDHLVFVTTTVALASKYPILEILDVEQDEQSITSHNLQGEFHFSRKPIKAIVELPNKEKIATYVNHFKSNRLNELEYKFTKQHTVEEKKEKTKYGLDQNISKSLKQRLCETSSLYFDLKKTPLPMICMCDLNDKEFSLSIEALTNTAYHDNSNVDSYILQDVYTLHEKKVYNPHPEQKQIKRTPTSYFEGRGDVLDFIFVSKEFDQKEKSARGKIVSYEVHDKHFFNNPHGSLQTSDHAQVVCEIELY